MNSTVKNILAVILGFILGSAVNMGIIMISGSIIPPPGGADVTTMEGLKESMLSRFWTLTDSLFSKSLTPTFPGVVIFLVCLRLVLLVFFVSRSERFFF